MSDQPEPPDPNRTVTPGGFHADSPFARQYQAPQPVDKPKPATAPPVVVNQKDLEEANYRLQEVIDAIEHARIGDSHVGRRVVTASGNFLSEELELVQGLIYRNLR